MKPMSGSGFQIKIEKLQILENKFSSLSGFVRNKKSTQWLVVTTTEPVNMVKNSISTKDSMKPKRHSKSTVKYVQTRSKITSVKRYAGKSTPDQ